MELQLIDKLSIQQRRCLDKAVEFIQEKKRAMLALQPGAGKTLIIKSFLNAKGLLGTEKHLIIGHPRILKENWSDCNTLSNFQLGKLSGNEKFDVVVYDESTRFKNHRSKCFLQAKKIPLAEYVISLSGTHISTGFEDVWTQYFLLDKGQRLGQNITTFHNRYFRILSVKPRIELELLADSPERILDAVRDITFTYKLPKVRQEVIDIKIELTNAQRNLMKELKTNKGVVVGEQTILAAGPAEVKAKQRQIASGFILGKDGAIPLKINPKINWLRMLLANIKPIIVVYHYVMELHILQKEFGSDAQRLEKASLADWNAGKIPVLLISQAGCVHGLNLQFGGSTIVWFSNTGSHERFTQLNGRLTRYGQASIVKIYRLITTIDRVLLKRINTTGNLYQQAPYAHKQPSPSQLSLIDAR